MICTIYAASSYSQRLSSMTAQFHIALDETHPAMLALQENRISDFIDMCEGNPWLLSKRFTIIRLHQRREGTTESKIYYEGLLSFALRYNREEIIKWLLQKNCIDNSAFRLSVMLGEKNFVELFCQTAQYQEAISQNAALLLDALWQHPCPMDILSILFSYMSLIQIEQLIANKNPKKATMDALEPLIDQKRMSIKCAQVLLRC